MSADPRGVASPSGTGGAQFPRWFGRIRAAWAQTFNLGRHWRLAVEWIPAARSFDFWLYDERRNDG